MMQKKKKVSVSKNDAIGAEIGLKQSLVKTRNAIRKKFQELHSGKQLLSEKISETFKPIIDPIKSLKEEKKLPVKDESTPIKSEAKNEKDSIFKTPYPTHHRNVFGVIPKKLTFNTPDPDSLRDIGDDYSESVKQKIREQVKQISSADKDNVYGIRSHHGELYMGKEPIKIKTDNNELKYSVGNKTFTVTPGLTDLLLMNNPQVYSNQDLERYKDMLIHTNAHKKNYNPSGIIRRSKSSAKYNKIISNLFPERRSSRINPSKHQSNAGISNESIEGEGVPSCWRQRQQRMKRLQTAYKTYNRDSAYDYKYWDDPNELVDRLRLLVSSQSAGHTGHNNEIIAIIEELREAKIIV